MKLKCHLDLLFFVEVRSFWDLTSDFSGVLEENSCKRLKDCGLLSGFVGFREESIPQRLKPPSPRLAERAKPEGLAYLDASAKAETRASAQAKATADPCGM